MGERFEWFVRWEVSGRTIAIVFGAAFRTCLKEVASFLCSFSSSIYTMRFVKLKAVQPYSSIKTITVGKRERSVNTSLCFTSAFLQSAGVVEYTDCFSAEGYESPPRCNKCPGYDTKQSDSQVPVMLELWGMRNTLLFLLFLGPLLSRVVAPDRVLSRAQIELTVQRASSLSRPQQKHLKLPNCISHSTNTIGKGMNPIILPPAMGK